MHKIKLILTMVISVITISLFAAMPAFALTEGDWEFQLLDNEVKITGYLGNGGDVVIPETIYGCPVTKMDDAFKILTGDSYENANITSITFPGTIKNINFGATFGIKSLETLIFSEGVEGVNGCNIQEFPNLTTISLPSTFNRIGPNAFQGTTALKHIDIPAGVTIIANEAFLESGLEEIDLSHLNITELINTFEGCKNLKSVKLPNTLTKIGRSVFSFCSALTEIDIPASVTVIDGFAFEGTSLSQIILPSGLKELGNGVFAETKLQELVVPYGTEKVGKIFWPAMGLGSDCTTIKSIYLPDTIKAMDDVANKCPNAIVYCTSGSTAESYCKRNEISYLTDNSVNSGITVLYNGTRISFHSYGQNPELLNSRTLVPLRSIFEAMGAEVEWDNETSTAIAKRDGVEIKIQIGANEMYKDGKAIAVDVPAQLMNSRTMVPVRVIAEAFGADVQWNGNGNTVLINE